MQTQRNHTTQAAAIIQRSLDLSNWFFEHNPRSHTFEPIPDDAPDQDASYEKRLRVKVAFTLFEIALDHHTAIIFLCLNHMRSPAFALARSLFDAAWQGVWVAYAAPSDALHRFLEGKQPPKAGSYIKPMEKVAGIAPFFSKIYEQAYETLCSYTHGTHLQIQRWMGEEFIEAQHTDAEMAEVLRLCDQLAMSCSILLADLCGRDEEVMKAKATEVFNWPSL